MWWLILASSLAAARLPPATIEHFERSETTAGWPGWGLPAGPAAGAVTLDVDASGESRAGRLRYQAARSHVLLPAPDRALQGLPLALRLRVKGDRSQTELSATLLDATGEWLHTAGVGIDFAGWRDLRLDLTRFVDWAQGNQDGRPDPPLALLSINLAFRGRLDGELWFDDLVVEQEALPLVAMLATALTGPTSRHLFLPEDPPPAITVTNRGFCSVPVRASWRTGDAGHSEELLPAPGQTVSMPLRLPGSGPHTVQVVLRTDDGEQRTQHTLVMLPERVGGPDTFVGLGDHDGPAVADGQAVRDLPPIRAAGADWTMLSLSAEGGSVPTDWQAARHFGTLAWAQGTRVIGRLLPGWRGSEPARDEEPLAWLRLADARLGEDIRGWVLPAPRGAAGLESYLALLGVARAALESPKPILAELPSGGDLPRTDVDGVVIPFEVSGVAVSPGMPRAWQVLSAAAERARCPVWLWAATWPLESVSDQDPGAAVAMILACARATPNLQSIGWGQLHDGGGRRGLLGAGDDLRPEYVALAVSNRLLGGLGCHGLRSPAPEVYVASFGDQHHGTQVVWSEGEPYSLPIEDGLECYDILGRRLPAVTSLPIARSPIYLVKR